MRWTGCLLLGLLASTPLAAQTRPAARSGLSQPAAAPLPKPAVLPVKLDSVPRSEWKKGMIIGGAIGLVGGLWLQHGFSELGDSPDDRGPHFWFLMPTIVFALIGGLIGSMFHRK